MFVQAEIYKAVDANGHVTYSSTPIKGGKKIVLEPLSTMAPPSQRPAASPEGFPKVDGATQRGRDDTRRRILQDELSTEEKLLNGAKQALKEGEENPEVFKMVVGKRPDGSPITETRRNVAKYDEKIKSLNEQVDLHQKNIEALKTELSKLK
jgi:hypothetical protein